MVEVQVFKISVYDWKEKTRKVERKKERKSDRQTEEETFHINPNKNGKHIIARLTRTLSRLRDLNLWHLSYKAVALPLYHRADIFNIIIY